VTRQIDEQHGAEIERLHAALAFYANEKNYDCIIQYDFDGDDYATAPILDDEGARAREAYPDWQQDKGVQE
jgi:hypothetical protein